MAIGDVSEVPIDGRGDLYYLDTGMYDTAEYGAVYLIDDERPAIVDAGIGTDHERVLDAIEAVGIGRDELAVVALTHVHLDHAGGAGFVADACPNATVHAPDRGGRHLLDPARLVEGTKAAVGDQWQYYTAPEPVPEDRYEPYADGDAIDLGRHELRVHAAPGHAPHHHVFEEPTADVLFTADAAGLWIPSLDRLHPTSPPPQFDLEQCIEDVRALQDLDRSVLCFSHFGPLAADADVSVSSSTRDRPETGPDAIARPLEAYETVLTTWVDAVARRRDELGGDEAVVDHFVDRADVTEVWGEHKGRGEVAMNVRGVLGYLDRRDR